MMVADEQGYININHVFQPLLFTKNGAVFFADFGVHGHRSSELAVWEFSPERGHWVSLGQKVYPKGHKFRAVAERTRTMLLDGKALPSAPDGNADSPRKRIVAGMDRLTVDGQVYRWPSSIRHGRSAERGNVEQTSFFAMRDGAKEEFVVVRDHDDITFG